MSCYHMLELELEGPHTVTALALRRALCAGVRGVIKRGASSATLALTFLPELRACSSPVTNEEEKRQDWGRKTAANSLEAEVELLMWRIETLIVNLFFLRLRNPLGNITELLETISSLVTEELKNN